MDMSLEEFRAEMASYRLDAIEHAESFKDMQLVSTRLGKLYKKFDADERKMADQILGEWVLSEDESMRFDAMALIHYFKVLSAVGPLKVLSERLASSKSPGATHERQKIERILSHLAESTSDG